MKESSWRILYFVLITGAVIGMDALVIHEHAGRPLGAMNLYAIPFLLGMALGILAFRREDWRTPLALMMLQYLVFALAAGPVMQELWRLGFVEERAVRGTVELVKDLGPIGTPQASIAITAMIVSSYALSALVLWRTPRQRVEVA